MARHRFGGGIADYVIQFGGEGQLLLGANATVTFYNLQTGGVQLTSLTDTTGTAITSVTSDANGAIPQLNGPDGVREMWADASGGAGPRRLMHAHVGDELGQIRETDSGLQQQINTLSERELDGLSDVDASSPSDGDVIVFVAASGTWQPATGGSGGATTLDGLGDVDTSGVTDGQTLIFDGATGTWLPGSGGGGATALDGLSDVEAPSPVEGQVLRFAETESTWGPETLSASDVGALPDTFTAPVQSVDGQTGTVDLSSVYDAAGTAAAEVNAWVDGVSHRARNGDGSWPARHSSSALDVAIETNPGSPDPPADMASGDLYMGPSGLEGTAP